MVMDRALIDVPVCSPVGYGSQFALTVSNSSFSQKILTSPSGS
jgi:hypothetical protein